MQNILQAMAARWPDQKMHMVGHDDVIAQLITVAVKVVKCLLNNFCDGWIAQAARTVSCINHPLHLLGEPFVIFLPGLFAPWLRMMGLPNFLLRRPRAQPVLG